VRIPARDGEALASVYREGEVLEQAQEGTEISLVARVPEATLGRLRQRAGVVVETA
jgi:hypothetical protein